MCLSCMQVKQLLHFVSKNPSRNQVQYSLIKFANESRDERSVCNFEYHVGQILRGSALPSKASHKAFS